MGMGNFRMYDPGITVYALSCTLLDLPCRQAGVRGGGGQYQIRTGELLQTQEP
jgi:hypothetical protein